MRGSAVRNAGIGATVPAVDPKEEGAVGTELLPWVFTSGWASGINAYAVVLVMGLVGRLTDVAGIPHVLERTDVLIIAAALTLVEMVADKVPYLDSAWDAVHTVIRPALGATVGYLLGHQTSSVDAAFSAATGGLAALASHAIKASLRAAVNTSPEPASNIAVSSAEDVTVAGLIILATAHPWLSATIAAVLLVLGAALAIWAVRRLSRVKARYDAWGERVGRAASRPHRGAGRPERLDRGPPRS